MALVNHVSGSVFNETDFTAYYKLSDVNDSSPGGQTLTNVNTTTFIAGKFGNCSHHVRADNSYLYNTSDMGILRTDNNTKSAWVKFTDVAVPSGAVYGIVGFGNYNTSYRTNIYYEYTSEHMNSLVHSFQVNGATDDRASYAVALSAGVWYHVCGVYDYTGGNMFLYLNGVPVATVPIDKTGTGEGEDAGLVVGGMWILGSPDYGTPGTYRINGDVDEVLIFNRAWTAQEVYNYYQQYKSALSMGSNY